MTISPRENNNDKKMKSSYRRSNTYGLITYIT